jgi:scyllo-inositol 2-dehydrogenase (NADP+)
MKQSKIKLGIIGMGRMGITHYSIINSHPDVEIRAVADTSSLVVNLIKKYLKEVQTYDDYNKLLKEESLDALIICTPPALHYPIAFEAAQKDIHVFSEKPFTTDNKKAGELAELFNHKNLVNQVGYVNRFNDIFKTVKQYIEQGVIGKVIRFKSEMFSSTITQSEEDSGWRGSRLSGGGVVFEMASHAIDLVNYFLGKPDKVVGSSLTQIYSKNVEDTVSSTFLYKNGVSGTLYINWSDTSYRKPTNKIEIFGDSGRILADQHSLKIFMNKPHNKYNLRQGWNTLYITDVFSPVPFYVRGNEFTRQLYHFAECINKGETATHCSFNDGANVLEVIENIFRDYEQNGKL